MTLALSLWSRVDLQVNIERLEEVHKAICGRLQSRLPRDNTARGYQSHWQPLGLNGYPFQSPRLSVQGGCQVCIGAREDQPMDTRTIHYPNELGDGNTPGPAPKQYFLV
jgi:hypothetical protein